MQSLPNPMLQSQIPIPCPVLVACCHQQSQYLCLFFPPHLPLDINKASGPSFPSTSKSGESSSESFKQVPVMLNCRRGGSVVTCLGLPCESGWPVPSSFTGLVHCQNHLNEGLLLHCPTPHFAPQMITGVGGWEWLAQGEPYQSYNACSLKRGGNTFTYP